MYPLKIKFTTVTQPLHSLAQHQQQEEPWIGLPPKQMKQLVKTCSCYLIASTAPSTKKTTSTHRLQQQHMVHYYQLLFSFFLALQPPVTSVTCDRHNHSPLLSNPAAKTTDMLSMATTPSTTLLLTSPKTYTSLDMFWSWELLTTLF